MPRKYNQDRGESASRSRAASKKIYNYSALHQLFALQCRTPVPILRQIFFDGDLIMGRRVAANRNPPSTGTIPNASSSRQQGQPIVNDL